MGVYQLTGLMLVSERMTLVVSLLLALMKDQVDSMKVLGHPVDLLASSLTLDEKIATKNQVKKYTVFWESLCPAECSQINLDGELNNAVNLWKLR